MAYEVNLRSCSGCAFVLAAGQELNSLLFWLAFFFVGRNHKMVSSSDLWEQVLQQLPANVPRSARLTQNCSGDQA